MDQNGNKTVNIDVKKRTLSLYLQHSNQNQKKMMTHDITSAAHLQYFAFIWLKFRRDYSDLRVEVDC